MSEMDVPGEFHRCKDDCSDHGYCDSGKCVCSLALGSFQGALENRGVTLWFCQNSYGKIHHV